MKNINSVIRLQIQSQTANPSPPIGSILGQKGINIIDFCKKFNDLSKNIEKGRILTAIIFIYNDKTFDFNIKFTPTSLLIKEKLNLKKGSSNSGKNNINKISKNQLIEIAKLKINDTFNINIKSVLKSIIGTAKSMGIDVV